MTDRELLENAAKAAGLNVLPYLDSSGEWVDGRSRMFLCSSTGHAIREWNPLTDDGDEARLEATLQMHVEWRPATENVTVGTAEISCTESYGNDRQAARKRAGTRAAAAIRAAK